MVQDRISITLITCSKHNYITMSTQVFYDFLCMGSDIDITAYYLALEGFEWDFYLITFCHDVTCMD